MSFNIDNALGVHAQALVIRGRRAELLAGNMANSDTPNYKAQDIDFKAALSQAASATGSAGSIALLRTNASHLSVATPVAQDATFYRTPSASSLDGNTVDTQIEQAEFMDNAVRYEASLNLVGKKLRGLLSAIRGD